MILFISVVVCFGMTLLLVESTIFSPLREFLSLRSNFLNKLLSCMLCSGVWIGFCYSFLYTPFEFNYYINLLLGSVFYGTMTWILHLIETKLNG